MDPLICDLDSELGGDNLDNIGVTMESIPTTDGNASTWLEVSPAQDDVQAQEDVAI